MNRNIRQKSGWSDLPPELLSTIVSRLDSQSNIVNFRGVCKNWRTSTRPPLLVLDSSLPRKVTFNNTGNIFVNTSFSVVSTAVYLLRQWSDPSAEPWLVAVEQLSACGKLRLFHPLSRNPILDLPENFPEELPNNFFATRLSQGINIRLNDGITPALLGRQDNNDTNNSYNVNKVVFWPNNPKTVLVLYNLTQVIGFTLLSNSGGWETVKGFTSRIDDIILWRSMVWAVSSIGRLFGIDCQSMEVTVTGPTSKNFTRGRRKRLVLDAKNYLYMMVVTNGLFCDEFEVHRLNPQFRWVKLVNLGRDLIFFVSFDTCFISNTQYFPGIEGNSIVFQKNSFPAHSSGSKYSDDEFFTEGGEEKEGNEYLQVGVHKYGQGKNFKLISAFPGFSAVFWPPPQWIWNTNEVQMRRPGTTEFQGIFVRSELVPILEKVWIKYGDIFEGSEVTNCEAKAAALSSLAKVISILGTITVNDFTDGEAQYLVSTMAELQALRLKVDWLVPLVEKAFVLHKSKPLAGALMELENAFVLYKSKSLAAALMELENAKAYAEEMRKEVSADIEKDLKFDSGGSKIVVESMLASELLDLDKCVGEGVL